MPEIEYHVQEFDTGEGGGWHSLLITNDKEEAKAYRASLDTDEKVAETIRLYGIRPDYRVMTAVMTPIDEADHLRIALLKTTVGLIPLIPADTDDNVGPTSLVHLQWMLGEITRKMDVWPPDKTSRWIGFVQGALATKGMLDVNAERARTRPIFHEAYAALGLAIPETVER